MFRSIQQTVPAFNANADLLASALSLPSNMHTLLSYKSFPECAYSCSFCSSGSPKGGSRQSYITFRRITLRCHYLVRKSKYYMSNLILILHPFLITDTEKPPSMCYIGECVNKCRPSHIDCRRVLQHTGVTQNPSEEGIWHIEQHQNVA